MVRRPFIRSLQETPPGGGEGDRSLLRSMDRARAAPAWHRGQAQAGWHRSSGQPLPTPPDGHAPWRSAWSGVTMLARSGCRHWLHGAGPTELSWRLPTRRRGSLGSAQPAGGLQGSLRRSACSGEACEVYGDGPSTRDRSLTNLMVYKAQAAEHVMRSEAADHHQGQEPHRSSDRPDRFTPPMPPTAPEHLAAGASMDCKLGWLVRSWWLPSECRWSTQTTPSLPSAQRIGVRRRNEPRISLGWREHGCLASPDREAS